MVISVVGTAMSFVWCLIQRRIQGHIFRYEKLQERLEMTLGFNPKYALSANINKEDRNEYLGMKPRARTTMKVCSLFILVIWSLALVYFVIKIISPCI